MNKKQTRGRPKKYTEAEIMQQKIDKYFADCVRNKEPYTITGLCIALDLCRDTLSEYMKKEEFSDTIKKGYNSFYRVFRSYNIYNLFY